MSDSNKNLITSAIHLPEVEEDDDRDLIGNAEIRCDFLSVIENIGNGRKCIDEILLTKENILSQDIKNLQIFCSEILYKINKVYDYYPPFNYDVLSLDDVEIILGFVRYLEYDICYDIYNLLINLKIKIENFSDYNLIKEKLKQNFNNEIDKILKIKNNQLIFDFLRTNNKEKIINLIMKRLEENLVSIQFFGYWQDFEKGEL